MVVVLFEGVAVSEAVIKSLELVVPGEVALGGRPVVEEGRARGGEADGAHADLEDVGEVGRGVQLELGKVPPFAW